ncbi:MAG: VIT1/CCC1 transporter family protein [Anaerolineae bacterium]
MNDKQLVLVMQRDEITSAELYKRLAVRIKDAEKARLMLQMADTERAHYAFWRGISQRDVHPDRFRISLLLTAMRLLGISFVAKLLERSEHGGIADLERLARVIPETGRLVVDSHEHEQILLGMVHEEFLDYMGAIVLGLNDALVELTGALAGLTLALQNGRLVAVTGLITGIAAALSMASSEYFSKRADASTRAVSSAFYTGLTYLLTVVLLVLPFIVLPSRGSWIFVSLGITIVITVLIILAFNFYISVAKSVTFRNRFLEMLFITLGVAALSFLFGLVVRSVFGVQA